MVVEQWHQQNRGWEVQQRTDNRNIHLQANNLEELEPVDVCRHATDEQAESVQGTAGSLTDRHVGRKYGHTGHHHV